MVWCVRLSALILYTLNPEISRFSTAHTKPNGKQKWSEDRKKPEKHSNAYRPWTSE